MHCKATLGQGQSWLMRKIFVMNHAPGVGQCIQIIGIGASGIELYCVVKAWIVNKQRFTEGKLLIWS